MREMIWNAVRSKVPEGMILPWWALAVRAVLYPLDAMCWYMGWSRGYQWHTDTWKIEGVTYSGAALKALAKAQGEIFRVTRTGDTVTLERVQNGEVRGASRLSGEASSAEGATSTVVLGHKETNDGN